MDSSWSCLHRIAAYRGQTYLGNANYRDVNQNRRCDVLFEPELGEENIHTFFALIQTGGYNPLVAEVICAAESSPCADFKEGYWCDHRTYNLDLIESFLAVFPDQEETLLFEKGHGGREYNLPPCFVMFFMSVFLCPSVLYCRNLNRLKRNRQEGRIWKTSRRTMYPDMLSLYRIYGLTE